mmetsp:Transcript_49853/g.92872  ORF Transcript_49853/g.92872 Transcript_49853/m.92872 type:complete len:197 (-) Transcript_49853:816-1406(-)
MVFVQYVHSSGMREPSLRKYETVLHRSMNAELVVKSNGDNAGREDPWCVRSRRGCVFLTGRRIIFVALEPHDFGLHSIDMPLLNIQTAQLRKRLLGSRCILSGQVETAPSAGLPDLVNFKIKLRDGSGKSLFRALRSAMMCLAYHGVCQAELDAIERGDWTDPLREDGEAESPTALATNAYIGECVGIFLCLLIFV